MSDRATAIIEVSPRTLGNRDGGILLVRERFDYKQRLGLPGGGQNSGERSTDTAVREIAEELRVRVTHALKLFEIVDRAGRKHKVCVVKAEGTINPDYNEILGIQFFATGRTIPDLKMMSHVTKSLLGPNGYIHAHRASYRKNWTSDGLIIPEGIKAASWSDMQRMTN